MEQKKKSKVEKNRAYFFRDFQDATKLRKKLMMSKSYVKVKYLETLVNISNPIRIQFVSNPDSSKKVATFFKLKLGIRKCEKRVESDKLDKELGMKNGGGGGACQSSRSKALFFQLCSSSST